MALYHPLLEYILSARNSALKPVSYRCSRHQAGHESEVARLRKSCEWSRSIGLRGWPSDFGSNHHHSGKLVARREGYLHPHSENEFQNSRCGRLTFQVGAGNYSQGNKLWRIINATWKAIISNCV